MSCMYLIINFIAMSDLARRCLRYHIAPRISLLKVYFSCSVDFLLCMYALFVFGMLTRSSCNLRSFTVSEIMPSDRAYGYLEIQYAFIKVSGNNDQRKISLSFSVNAPLR